MPFNGARHDAEHGSDLLVAVSHALRNEETAHSLVNGAQLPHDYIEFLLGGKRPLWARRGVKERLPPGELIDALEREWTRERAMEVVDRKIDDDSA